MSGFDIRQNSILRVDIISTGRGTPLFDTDVRVLTKQKAPLLDTGCEVSTLSVTHYLTCSLPRRYIYYIISFCWGRAYIGPSPTPWLFRGTGKQVADNFIYTPQKASKSVLYLSVIKQVFR